MIRIFVQELISVFSPDSAIPGLESLLLEAISCAVVGGTLMSLLLNQYEFSQQEEYVAHYRTLHIRNGREKKETTGKENYPILK